jgi:O-acetyl-ADP-ribose deacetylase (regulator of RNase III)
MEIIGGDLLEMIDEFDVVVHGCNCFNTMGSGIARQIKNAYPDVYAADRATIKGDKSKLGKYSNYYDAWNDVVIINAYTQYSYGNVRSVNYEAVAKVFASIKGVYGNLKIAYPMIGAGLGGGNWKIISTIIDEELRGCDHTLVIYPQ